MIFDKLAVQLEPDALLPLKRNSFSYSVPFDKTVYLIASWGTRLGASGRMEVRNPTKPMALRGVALSGYVPCATAILLDPDKPIYLDAQQTYYDRLNAIDEMQLLYISITAPNQIIPFLPGAYGAIITRVVNMDFDWIIGYCARNGFNFANERGDGSADYQRNDSIMLMPCNKTTINEVGSSLERIPGAGIGSVCYVLLPASWSCVADPNTYIFRDDFMTPTLDLTKWNRVQSTAGYVEINPLYQWLKLVGNGAWGTNGIISIPTFERGQSLIVDVYPGQNAMTVNTIVGWSDGQGYSYTNFLHGVLFNQGNGLQVFEGGVNKPISGTWSCGSVYRVRITTQASGAVYEIQGGAQYPDIGCGTWANITPAGTSGSQSNLYLGASPVIGSTTTYISDFRVT